MLIINQKIGDTIRAPPICSKVTNAYETHWELKDDSRRDLTSRIRTPFSQKPWKLSYSVQYKIKFKRTQYYFLFNKNSYNI